MSETKQLTDRDKLPHIDDRYNKKKERVQKSKQLSESLPKMKNVQTDTFHKNLQGSEQKIDLYRSLLNSNVSITKNTVHTIPTQTSQNFEVSIFSSNQMQPLSTDARLIDCDSIFPTQQNSIKRYLSLCNNDYLDTIMYYRKYKEIKNKDKRNLDQQTKKSFKLHTTNDDDVQNSKKINRNESKFFKSAQKNQKIEIQLADIKNDMFENELSSRPRESFTQFKMEDGENYKKKQTSFHNQEFNGSINLNNFKSKYISSSSAQMNYNIKSMERLQKKIEGSYMKDLKSSNEYMIYLKQNNRLSVIAERNKHLEQMQNVSSRILTDIEKQNNRINQVLDVFTDHYKLNEYTNDNQF